MSEPTTSTERLAILYGSETGNSESIAKRLHHAAVHNHGHPDALCLTLNQAITKKILDGQCSEEATPLCLVIVCSTTGEGEPPENAARFRRWLRNHPTTTPLHHLRFTVLALGDTNYNNFCAAGIYMDNKLHEAGGVRFYARGEADDGIGLDLVVEPWMEHLWPAMIGQPEQGVSHTRYQTTNITEQRWNMAVAQEVLILYDCNSLLCSTYALYVYERLTELGGVGELQPVQHLVVERLARTPKLLLLLASADAGADGAQAMSTQHKPDAEVGGGAPSPSSPSSSSTTSMWMDLQAWLAVAGLRAAQSLCILTSPAEVQRAVVVESALRELLHACKLEAIVRKVPHTPTIATSAADLLLWCEAVLDTTPGITHDTATIRVALERRFGKHVLPALRLANATHGGDDGMAAFDGNERTRGDAEEGGADHGRLLHGPILSDLLTPLVFLYASTGSRLSAEVAQRMHATAEEHQLRSSLTDISKLRMTGFPRRATFIFIVNGISKAMSRVMKVLRDGVRRGKHLSQDNFAGVRFAILGIDNGRRSDHFNLCALELETLLLSLHATKIHATGLVDEGCQDSVPAVLQAWESNLLSAVMAPTTSRAYLDAQSPNITSVAPVFPSFGGPLPRGVEGGVDVAAPEVMAQILSSPTSTQSFERIISPVQPTTTTPTKTEGGTQTNNNNNNTAGMLMMMMEDGATNATTLPWRPLPLHRANVAHTPLTLLYASSGMPKAMALHACKAAQEMGFVATTHSLADTQRMDFSQHPNLLLFCEGGRLAGQNRGAQLLRRSLLHPSRRPDALSFVRFSILGLGAVEPAHTHPAFQWAGLLARLQANRVFPVVVMRSMSQLHSFGLPWCECAMAAMAAQPPLLVPPSNNNTNTNTATTRDDDGAAAAAATNKDATLVQPTTNDVPSDGAKVLFLFGSSTGMAEAIARDLHQQALQLGYASRVAALKFFEKMSFLTTPHVIIVCSTTNLHVGGFPSNARKFAQYLQLRAQPRNLLTGTHYAVLGVGNESAYPHTFCSAAIRIDARLEELGGRRICEMGRLDVSHSILARMAAWRVSLFDALRATTTEAQGVMVEEDSSSTSCHHSHHHHHPSALVPPALPTSEGCTDASCPSSPATLQKWGVLLVQGSSDTSAVMGITEHLRQVIQDNTTLQPATCTMNEFAKLTWRTRYRLIIFLVASNDEGDCPLNATAFFRLLRHKSTPRDLFASVRYTVMAVSDTNEGRFYLGRQLDRRLEELGGTRCFARGEAVDSFRLERTVERWIHGLMAILADACEECSEGAQQQQQQQRAMAPCAARTTNKLGSANFNHATTSSDKNNTAAAASSHVDDGDGAMDAADLTAMAASPVDRIAAFMPRTGSDEVRVEAVLDGWRCLTSPHVQECGGTVLVMHLRVAPEVVWVPGQTVAILPPNPHEAVQRVLRYFDVKAEMPFHPLSVAGVGSSSYPNAPLYESVDFPVSAETLLLRYVGITLSPTNSRGLMEMLLQRSGEHAEMQERIRAYWQEMCATRVPRRLEEVLDALPHLPITLRHLVEHLPLLQPRIYSICSSKLATPTRLSLCFKVVPHGLCTHWLLDQCVWAARLSTNTNTNTNTMSSSVAAASAGWGCEVRAQRMCGLSLVLRPTSDFIMPPQLTTPLISIGPGTGVAPFRAFIEERGALMRQQQQNNNNNNNNVEEPSTCAATLGSMELFFGCRRREDDFLFAEELVEAERCGILSSLHVAFSREPNNDGSFWYGGCYVQDKMLEAAGVLVDVLVHRQGRLYVCGDAEMAKEVHQTFLDILQQHLCISATAAATLVENMVSRGEYLRDVWTTSLP